MKNLRVLTLVNACFYLAIGTGGPFINLFFEGLGASYGRIAQILVLYMVVTIAANTFYGRFADRLGPRRPWLITGLALQAVGYATLALAGELVQAGVGRVLEGLGVALFATVSLAIVGELVQNSANKGRVIGVYRGIGSLSFAAGALLGGLLADRYGLDTPILTGMGFFAAGACVALLLEAGPRPRPRVISPLGAVAEGSAPGSTLPRSSLPWAFLVGVVLLMGAQSASSSMFPNYLNSLGHSKTAIGGLWSLTAALELPAMFLSGALADIFGRAPLLAAGAIAIATVQMLYVGAARIWNLIFGAQVIRAFGFSSYTANSMTYTAEISHEGDRSVNSGVFNVAQNAGQLLGMGLGGTLAQWLGFPVMFGVCSALALAGAVSFLWLRPRGRKASLRDAEG